MVCDTRSVPDYYKRLRMDGRVFVVLGAGNGIGRQTAHALSQVGASVVCVDREAELAREVAGEVGGLDLVADVMDRAQVETLFATVAAEVGPPTGLVDIVGLPVPGHLTQLDDEQWDRQFDVVLRHAFIAMQVGGREIARAGGGAMVFVGSNSGLAHMPGMLAYGTAKAALHHLVGSSARDLAADNVRVNAVAPGFTRTPRLEALLDEEGWRRAGARIPRGSAASPDEIASVILFLASDMASYVTGHVLVADGGRTGTIADSLTSD